MTFSDIKIGHKILGIVLIFCVTSAATAAWQHQNLAAAKSRYEQVIREDQAALLAGARMGQYPPALLAAAQNLVVETCPSVACYESIKEMSQSRGRFIERYNNAVNYDPEHDKDWFAMKSEFDRIYSRLWNDMIPLVTSNQLDKARKILRSESPKINILRENIRHFVILQEAQGDKEIGLLGDKLQFQAISSLTISIFVNVLIVAFASFIAFADISRILGRLAMQMNAIAKGNLNTVIDGQDRCDEVGQMAKTMNLIKGELAEAVKIKAELESTNTVYID